MSHRLKTYDYTPEGHHSRRTWARTATYAYDHRGRMVRKEILPTSTNSTFSILHSTFVWDGWNIIRETTSNLSTFQPFNFSTSYVWGLDLDGTLQGAGGVGGLLAVVRDGGVFLPAYDANGNVTEYVATNGSVAAHYEYSAFGEPIVSDGELASSFTHQFSTKPYSAVTGFHEYVYRKYRPEIGRWMSRDLLFEMETVALYNILRNSSIQNYDFLGLFSLSGFFDGRVSDYLVCMGDCIEDNDPLNVLSEKVSLALAGAVLPKTVIAKLARMTGDAKFADEILRSLKRPGVKPITTVPSVFAHYFGDASHLKHLLRRVGDVGARFWLAYGAYMAAVEASCAIHCCASIGYDSNTGIYIPGLSEILDLGTNLWQRLLEKANEWGTLDVEQSFVY